MCTYASGHTYGGISPHVRMYRATRTYAWTCIYICTTKGNCISHQSNSIKNREVNRIRCRRYSLPDWMGCNSQLRMRRECVKTKPGYPIVRCRGRGRLPEDTKQTVFGRALRRSRNNNIGYFTLHIQQTVWAIVSQFHCGRSKMNSRLLPFKKKSTPKDALPY